MVNKLRYLLPRFYFLYVTLVRLLPGLIRCVNGIEQNGEEVCENQGYDLEECESIWCCYFEDGECWSSVGRDRCEQDDDDDDDDFFGDDYYVGDGNTGNEDSMMNGEEACENHGFSKTECLNVGCCFFDDADGTCWSSVLSDLCVAPPSGDNISDLDGDEVVLPTYGIGSFSVRWVDGFDGLGSCGKVTFVFGVAICVSKRAWRSCQQETNAKVNKCDYLAQVMAQLIDNNADGIADDERLIKYMATQRFHMFIPATLDESITTTWDNGYFGYAQNQALDETVPDSCMIPSNRGASLTDRTTWEASVDNSNNCNPERGSEFEEFHHLLNEAASQIYPDIWGTDFASSEVGRALLALNGNCGWGYTRDWTNPGGQNSRCRGHYAYQDRTCNEACLVVEGTYWASTTYVGGLYTSALADFASEEWLLTAPDRSMTPLPKGHRNAATLEEASPALYNLVSDTTSFGHQWLPEVMTTGRYVVKDDSPNTNGRPMASNGFYPGIDRFL